MSEVVGLFTSRAQAEQAIQELDERGYDATDLGYVDRYRDEGGEVVTDEGYFDDDDYMDEDHEVAHEAGKGAAGGAIGGAAVGAGTALLASAGLVLIPGIGPFLAAGTLAGVLGSAAVGAAGGAALGGAAGAIFGAVDDHEHADHEISRHYRDRVSAGETMVSVNVDDDSDLEVTEVLNAAGASRVDIYGGQGWVSV